jgi:hypothetical protein
MVEQTPIITTMADPLTQTVEQFAPAPLNVFDQAQAETLMSRYAGARDVADNRRRLEEEARRASQARREEAMARRQEILATRDDLEYAMRKDADEQRSQFLADAIETLKPEDEGYYEREASFLQKAPPSLLKDEAFRGVISGLKTIADRRDKEREDVREIEKRAEISRATFREKQKSDKLYANLSQEDWNSLPKDENGEPIQSAAMRLALQREREAKDAADAAKVDRRKEAALDILDRRNMNEQQKDVFDETKDIIIQDDEAFPRRAFAVMQRANQEGLDPSFDPDLKLELAKAKDWDKNIFKNEVLAAKSFENPDDYVNMEGMEGISDRAKQSRLRVWEYAHQNKVDNAGNAAPAAAAPAPAARTITRQYVEGDYAIREFSDGTRQRKKIK